MMPMLDVLSTHPVVQTEAEAVEPHRRSNKNSQPSLVSLHVTALG